MKSFSRKRDRTCISGALEQFYCPASDSTEFGPCACVPRPSPPAPQTASFPVASMPQEIQDALQTLIETGDSVGESDMDPAVLEKLKNYLGKFLKNKIDWLKTHCPDWHIQIQILKNLLS